MAMWLVTHGGAVWSGAAHLEAGACRQRRLQPALCLRTLALGAWFAAGSLRSNGALLAGTRERRCFVCGRLGKLLTGPPPRAQRPASCVWAWGMCSAPAPVRAPSCRSRAHSGLPWRSGGWQWWSPLPSFTSRRRAQPYASVAFCPRPSGAPRGRPAPPMPTCSTGTGGSGG
jgi:hypothetical protein